MTILTVLGGGSAYTPGLLKALIAHNAELRLEAVRLYDIDASRLAVVGRLGAAMARAAGAFRVETVATLADAVRGAYLNGLSYEDLAQRHSVPINTMRSWLRRGLQRLKECLES